MVVNGPNYRPFYACVAILSPVVGPVWQDFFVLVRDEAKAGLGSSRYDQRGVA